MTLLDSELQASYDELAPHYDGFTAGYAYESWLAKLEEQALELGLRGNRVLDVGCGTGKSTEPLIERGYQVLGCDISEEMLHEARRKFPHLAHAFVQADMRALPHFGEFDLVLCLDDGLNYLLSEDELRAAFTGIAASLAPDGLFVFDLNSLLTYRHAFAQTWVREAGQTFFAWQGETDATFGAGELAGARIEIFAEREDGLWARSQTYHRQRHHPSGAVHRALKHAGLRCCRLLGQRRGAQLDETFDETNHGKLVYFARRDR